MYSLEYVSATSLDLAASLAAPNAHSSALGGELHIACRRSNGPLGMGEGECMHTSGDTPSAMLMPCHAMYRLAPGHAATTIVSFLGTACPRSGPPSTNSCAPYVQCFAHTHKAFSSVWFPQHPAALVPAKRTTSVNFTHTGTWEEPMSSQLAAAMPPAAAAAAVA